MSTETKKGGARRKKAAPKSAAVAAPSAEPETPQYEPLAFLGRYEHGIRKYDLYVTGPYVLARWGGSLPDVIVVHREAVERELTMSASNAEHCPALAEAHRRASKRKLLPK